MSLNSKNLGSVAIFAAGAVLVALVSVWTGSPPLSAVITGVAFFLVAIVAIFARSRSRGS